MKNTDALVQLLLPDIARKEILEVACGGAEFSCSAVPFAAHVSAIDLEENRVNLQRLGQLGVEFQPMDAARMTFPDGAFDTVFLYNAFFHVQTQWDEIEKECGRVLKKKGVLYVVGTWKLDTDPMIDRFGDRAVRRGPFLIARLEKQTADL